MSTLEKMVDQGVYEAMLKTRPGLVTAVQNAISMGETPAQIERQMAQRFGRKHEMVRYVRAIAEHINRMEVAA